MPLEIDSTRQFSMFKDALATRVISKSMAASGDDMGNATELDDFTLYLAEETWSSLPAYLQSLTHSVANKEDALAFVDSMSLDTTPTAFVDTLVSCRLSDDYDNSLEFLRKALADYVSEACAPPPVWSRTRTTECEICEREVPLTYHHLIPRETHAKVLKKKWHPESMLNSVAWLCRPCHSAVHRVASNEELAREYHTLELLLNREDIQKWRAYAAKQRFGVKRG